VSLLNDAALAEATRAIDLAGVFANAVLGGVVAARARLDPVGFVALAVISGTGGGLIRDTLLQHGTPVALTDYAYLLTALAGAGLAYLLRVEGGGWHRVLMAVDAAAIGCWAVAGAQKTLEVGLGWLPALLLGTITAVGGGVTRDVLMRRVPSIFGGNEIYAIAALAASAVVVAVTRLGLPSAGVIGGIAVGTGLRLLAMRYGWTLPRGRVGVPDLTGGRRAVRSWRAGMRSTRFRAGRRSRRDGSDR